MGDVSEFPLFIACRPDILSAGESQKRKNGSRPETRRRLEIQRRLLEPALFAGDVGGDKILVALGQINDAFDETDDPAYATS